MTEPEDLQILHGHPMPTRDHATLLASYRLLLDLARECLPVRVMPTGQTTFFEDLEVTRAAFIARMSGTLRHLGYLVPSYPGSTASRDPHLVDHVITFAWISADPKERLPAFLRGSFKNLLRKDAQSRGRGDERANRRLPARAPDGVYRQVDQRSPGYGNARPGLTP